MLSKETGFLFLIITVLYVFLYKKPQRFFTLYAACAVFAVYLVLRIHAIGIFTHLSTSSIIANSPLSVRLITIPAMFLFYLKTFFYPVGLAMSYQWVYTTISFTDFWLPLLIDLVFLSLILGFAYVVHKKFSSRCFNTYIFFTAWFVIGMLFHMQLLPLDATVADRWFYFPIVGLLGLMSALIEAYHVRIENKWSISIVIVILVILSAITFVRSFDWRNEITLGTHDLTVSDAWGTEDMLSAAYGRVGDFKDAKIHAEKSIVLYPHMFNYLNLGVIDENLGEYSEAKTAYLHSIKLGDYYQTYESLAYLDTVYGDPKTNINFIKNTALKKFPGDGTLWFCLAILTYNQGNKEDAKIDITKAYTFNQAPQIASVYNDIMKGQQKKIIVNL